VKAAKTLILIFIVCLFTRPAFAGEPVSLVIGKNLKVGMPMKDVIALLGIPDKFDINRGTEPQTDSLAIEYPAHGVVIHTLNKKTTVEQIEVLSSFKGSFAEGVAIGAKFNDLIAKYGTPSSLNAQMARYPDHGMFFQLEKDVLISARVFAKDSKILDLQLIKR